ncbi:MAG: hypothetical protein HY537_17370 [Deltaproteobacteria bacterium]|nr:hypothetical protein [Deltaproteobacteria bacterium]
MSTEPNDIRLHLDKEDSDLSLYEEDSPVFVSVVASVENWEKIKDSLCKLRASNISAMLFLNHLDVDLEDEELQYVFSYLRDWDQLTLHNILQLVGDWVPQALHQALLNEAKTEMKWFREWWVASHDSRLHKYPGLPWRSFIRKIINENFEFASFFLKLAASAATAENIQATENLVRGFLENKKKVVCIFPKKWNKLQ